MFSPPLFSWSFAGRILRWKPPDSPLRPQHFLSKSRASRAWYLRRLSEGGCPSKPRPDELRSAEETGYVDTYTEPAPRPFNYLWMVPMDEGVSVEARGFQSGETEVGLLESFALDY